MAALTILRILMTAFVVIFCVLLVATAETED